MGAREEIVKGVKAPAASAAEASPVRSRSNNSQLVDRRSGDRRSGRSRGQIRHLERRSAEVQEGQISNVLYEPLLDADEAAELLHVPRSTIYELVRSRRLPHVRLGRSLRFTREQLARWVDENSFQ